MAQFNQRLVNHILGIEGGLVNDPRDKGGLTNKGVTIAFYRSMCKKVLGIKPSDKHFRNMTNADVSKFVKYYWDAAKGDKIQSQAVAEFLTDFYWGSGYMPLRVREVVRSLGEPNIDKINVFNDFLVNALNRQIKKNEQKLFDLLVAKRMEHYKKLSNWNVYKNGWTRRVNEQVAMLKDLIGKSAGIVKDPSFLIPFFFAAIIGVIWSRYKKKSKFASKI